MTGSSSRTPSAVYIVEVSSQIQPCGDQIDYISSAVVANLEYLILSLKATLQPALLPRIACL